MWVAVASTDLLASCICGLHSFRVLLVALGVGGSTLERMIGFMLVVVASSVRRSSITKALYKMVLCNKVLDGKVPCKKVLAKKVLYKKALYKNVLSRKALYKMVLSKKVLYKNKKVKNLIFEQQSEESYICKVWDIQSAETLRFVRFGTSKALAGATTTTTTTTWVQNMKLFQRKTACGAGNLRKYTSQKNPGASRWDISKKLENPEKHIPQKNFRRFAPENKKMQSKKDC